MRLIRQERAPLFRGCLDEKATLQAALPKDYVNSLRNQKPYFSKLLASDFM